jgi:hypothetical protein
VIPGNHEYFFGYRAWMAHFTAMEMRVLENNHAVLERDGGRLVLAGVTDLSESHSAHPAPDLVGALKGAPKDAAVILRDHQPRKARRAAVLGVALQLSGHTHGGMVLGLDRWPRAPTADTSRSRRRRWHDALREQRDRAVARLRAAARTPVGTHADHTAPRGVIERRSAWGCVPLARALIDEEFRKIDEADGRVIVYASWISTTPSDAKSGARFAFFLTEPLLKAVIPRYTV